MIWVVKWSEMKDGVIHGIKMWLSRRPGRDVE